MPLFSRLHYRFCDHVGGKSAHGQCGDVRIGGKSGGLGVVIHYHRRDARRTRKYCGMQAHRYHGVGSRRKGDESARRERSGGDRAPTRCVSYAAANRIVLRRHCRKHGDRPKSVREPLCRSGQRRKKRVVGFFACSFPAGTPQRGNAAREKAIYRPRGSDFSSSGGISSGFVSAAGSRAGMTRRAPRDKNSAAAALSRAYTASVRRTARAAMRRAVRVVSGPTPPHITEGQPVRSAVRSTHA